MALKYEILMWCHGLVIIIDRQREVWKDCSCGDALEAVESLTVFGMDKATKQTRGYFVVYTQ